MNIALENDIRYEDGEVVKKYHFDGVDSADDLISLISEMGEDLNDLTGFSYSGKKMENYDDFVKEIINDNLEEIKLLKFKAPGYHYFFVDFIKKQLTAKYLHREMIVIEPKISYYQFGQKIIKYNEPIDTFYELDNGKWYINPLIFDAFYSDCSRFTKMDFDEKQINNGNK